MRFPEPNKHRTSLGILGIIVGLQIISQSPPSKSRRFAYARDDLFQNRAFRVDGRLCFRSGTAGVGGVGGDGGVGGVGGVGFYGVFMTSWSS